MNTEAYRTQLLTENLGLARKHANEMANKTGLEYDDLYQVACMAIYKATKKFDPTLGYKFNTFAWRHVSNDLKTYVDKQMKSRADLSIDDDDSLMQVVDESVDIENRVFSNIMVNGIRELVTAEEFKFLWDRFVNAKSQKEIAKEMGISQGQVCRIEKRIKGVIYDHYNSQLRK